MRTGRRLPEVKLTVEENNRLVEWARRRMTAQALALRSRIVLACAQGLSNTEVIRRTLLPVKAANHDAVSNEAPALSEIAEHGIEQHLHAGVTVRQLPAVPTAMVWLLTLFTDASAIQKSATLIGYSRPQCSWRSH